jgi:hypothetical protein
MKMTVFCDVAPSCLMFTDVSEVFVPSTIRARPDDGGSKHI